MEKIRKLTDLWYSIVCTDHHKDRDCHWNIIEEWSYGELPSYRLEHYGYIYDEVSESYPTHELARKALKEHLENAIASETKWAKMVLEDKGWDIDNKERAEQIINLT